MRTISVDDVIASEGPRLPSSATAEKDFRVGTIVISDRAFSEAEYAFITLALRYWESDAPYDGSGAPPWNAATNGISTITVALPGIVFAGEPAAITVSAGDVTVTLGGQTSVTATVRDDVGVPVRDASVVFGESLSSATISADPVTTDGNGEATATFTADELGGFTITATVVEITDGVVVETALSTVIEVEVVEPPATRTQTLRPQWNLVGWTGETIDVTEATASILASLGAFFTWDAAASNFLSFNPALPPALNSLRQVPQGAGTWTFVNGNSNVAWEQPAFNEARAVSLRRGFNLVTWTGGDGAAVADAIAGLNGLEALFLWDAAAQTFLIFNPALPSALNTAKTIPHGAGVWVLMGQNGTWNQPAP